MQACKWTGKAQAWADRRAGELFDSWLQTKQGRHWIKNGRNCRRLRLGNVDPTSPYAHGFGLPQYLHDLVESIGSGDEERAKAIMLYN